jgi:hypothetical protein
MESEARRFACFYEPSASTLFYISNFDDKELPTMITGATRRETQASCHEK